MVVGLGRVELEAAMGPPCVAVGRVLVQDRLQMPLAEDQYPVSDLLPGSEHESSGISVRARPAGRDLHSLGTGVGQNGVKGRAELPGPVPDQEPEACGAIAWIHQQVRICRWRGHCAVHVEEIGGEYRGCCACRNCQVVSVCRCGAGGIFSAFSTLRIVDALTRWPGFSSSPWIRWDPQPLLSVASRSISPAISARRAVLIAGNVRAEAFGVLPMAARRAAGAG